MIPQTVSVVRTSLQPHFSSVSKWCQQFHPALHVTNVSMCFCVQSYNHTLPSVPWLSWIVKQKKHNFCWYDVFLFHLEYQLVIRECYGGDDGHGTATGRFYGDYNNRTTRCYSCTRGRLHIIHKTLISLLYCYRVLLYATYTILLSPF